MPPRLEVEDAPCGQTGRHFNPYNVDASSSPQSGEGSSDQYEVMVVMPEWCSVDWSRAGGRPQRQVRGPGHED